MAVQITKYKVACWLDKKKCEPVFGVKVMVPGTGWANVCEGTEPIFFKTETEAEKYIAAMKKERDRAGWLKPTPAAQIGR